MVTKESTCFSCEQFSEKELKSIEKKKSGSSKPAKLKAPVTATSSSRLLATIQQQRADKKELENLITVLKASIEKKSVDVEKSLHSDLQEMFKVIDKRNLTPFLKTFWEQQMEYIQQNPTQVNRIFSIGKSGH